MEKEEIIMQNSFYQLMLIFSLYIMVVKGKEF